MKRVCILLAMGLLLPGGSAVRAEEDGGVPGTVTVAPVLAAPAEPGCAAPACAGHCGKHSGRLCDWLLYKPPSGRCACHHKVAPCTPPLYTFFLDMCAAGGCNHGCAHAAPAVAPAPVGAGPEELPPPHEVTPQR